MRGFAFLLFPVRFLPGSRIRAADGFFELVIALEHNLSVWRIAMPDFRAEQPAAVSAVDLPAEHSGTGSVSRFLTPFDLILHTLKCRGGDNCLVVIFDVILRNLPLVFDQRRL